MKVCSRRKEVRESSIKDKIPDYGLLRSGFLYRRRKEESSRSVMKQLGAFSTLEMVWTGRPGQDLSGKYCGPCPTSTGETSKYFN